MYHPVSSEHSKPISREGLLFMINPLNRADLIIDQDPQLAEPLFDLIVYIIESDDPRNDPQIDRVLERVYARTEEGTRHRRSYKQKRVGSPNVQMPVENLEAVDV
jgi:hypothetical protein